MGMMYDVGLGGYSSLGDLYETIRGYGTDGGAAGQPAVTSLLRQAARKEEQASQILFQGQMDAAEQIVAGRSAVAAKRAGYSASGVRVDSGSALEVQADMAAWNEYERQKIIYQAELQSWGLRQDANQLYGSAYGSMGAAADDDADDPVYKWYKALDRML